MRKNKSHLGKKQSEESNKKRREKLLGRTFSDISREKMRESKKGNKNPQWKGGITEESYRIRNSIEYKLWRIAVFERDKYTCVWCLTKKSPFQADHIKRFSEYPELRFAIDNGRTLCVPCHKTTDTYGVWSKNKKDVPGETAA